MLRTVVSLTKLRFSCNCVRYWYCVKG